MLSIPNFPLFVENMPLSWSKFYIPREIRISQCHIHAALVFPPSYLLVLNLFLSKQFCRRDAEDSVSRPISTLSNIRWREWVSKSSFYYIIAHRVYSFSLAQRFLLSLGPFIRNIPTHYVFNKLMIGATETIIGLIY